MDATDLRIGDVMNHQSEAPNSVVDTVIVEKLNIGHGSISQNEDPNVNANPVELAAKGIIVDNLTEKDGEKLILQEELIGLALQKESEVEERNNSSNSTQGLGREVIEKASQPKIVATVTKKTKDGKICSVTSKQPLAIATKWRLSNDRKFSGSIKGLDSGTPKKLQTKTSCAPSITTNTKTIIRLSKKDSGHDHYLSFGGSSVQPSKKTLRKSLPKLPSQKTTLVNVDCNHFSTFRTA